MAQSSRILVGRDAELENLISQLGVAPASGALDGARHHVVLAGDAGVGKTRILTELTTRARDAGWQAYVGHCLDFGESAVSYLPVSEVIDRLVVDLPDVVEQVAAHYPVLTRLEPVRRVVGAARDDDGESLDRTTLFSAVHTLLDALADKAPTLLVIEDVHWADRSTRDLLTFLFTRPFTGPVAIVASYRSDDLHRRHPLRRQAAEWARLPGVERVALEPLDADDTDMLVRELVEGGLGDAQVRDIVERADGNAFFVEELVSAAAGPGRWVPEDLADLLLLRLDRLDDVARQVVRTAAVAGRKVRHGTLETVSGLTAEALDGAVREAVETSVLVPDGPAYSFRHALLAEAVYDDLLPGERVRLHQRYVDAIRSGAARGTAAELARHALLAGDRDTALDASLRAGDEAASVGGPDEAALHYQQALGLLAERGGDVDSALVDLVQKTAYALIASGQAARAEGLAREHRERLPADAPGLWRAQLLDSEVQAKFAYVTGDDVLPLTTEAVEALPDDAPDSVRARVLATHARVLTLEYRFDEAARFGEEALALAERVGLHGLAAGIAITLARPHGDSVESFLPALRAAIARAHDAGAVHAELRGRMMLGLTLMHLGQLDEAVEVFTVAHELALTLGLPWAPYAFDARIHLMWLHFAQGRWDAALALADVHDPPPVLGAWLTSQRLAIVQARGGDVAAAVSRLRPYWPQEVATVLDAAPVEMVAAGRRGGLDGVAAIMATYADAVEVLERAYGMPLEAAARLAAVAVGQISAILPTVAATDRAGVIEQVERLYAEGRAADASGRYAWGPEGRAWSARLEAETLRAGWVAGIGAPSPEELVAAWCEAEDAFEAFGHVYELACVRTGLAGVLRATGDQAGAREAVELARETARALGARPLLEELRALGSAPVRRGADELTGREREILALVAQGRTNGEIGRQLFISTKTVSVHVSNILAKLGAAGRTEAAAIGRRRGLVE
ncbi:helix-turn-helix transcriptional regulator [Nocardioides cheoyonin]|uniref:helix-turn-helix transcriptional regulator n=1 Tax=Nocardioides cheoyonin TaxID=3156615 RepID=UPI0032B50D23